MKKMNNKGFSLVELIIVIAIMAILIGVLAPQYIKYVEKSRISSDKDTIDSITKAVQTACTDDDYYIDLTADSDNVAISAGGYNTTGDALASAMMEFYGASSATKGFKSKIFNPCTVTVTIVNNASGSGASTLSASVNVAGAADNSANGPYDPNNF